jgi:cell division protein FtsA
MEEILALVQSDIRRSGWYDRIPAGLVMTGGASALPGTAELAESAFDMPIRIGFPLGVTGLVESVSDPRFATGVGLVQYGRGAGIDENRFTQGDDDSLWGRVLVRMREWLEDFF